MIQCLYFQVYLDFGLAVPKLSVQGMISSVNELLELAPIKKVTTVPIEKIQKKWILYIVISLHISELYLQ